VDMSKTYVDWAQRNMDLNGFSGSEHRMIQTDCLAWLEQQAASPERRFGLIFLDPPTFSSSKRMDKTFDVQRDHADIIRWAMDLLTDNGTLLFSNNFKKFRMNNKVMSNFSVEDDSAATIPEDFRRNGKIHRCWKIRRK